jgi:hypothetical protein
LFLIPGPKNKTPFAKNRRENCHDAKKCWGWDLFYSTRPLAAEGGNKILWREVKVVPPEKYYCHIFHFKRIFDVMEGHTKMRLLF